MAKRILTAVIWLPIVALGFAFAPIWIIMLAISALSAIGVYELLWATGFVRQKRLCAYSMFFAALVPLWPYFGSYFPLVLAGVCAAGYSRVYNRRFIDRGYEDIVRDLKSLGADIGSET